MRVCFQIISFFVAVNFYSQPLRAQGESACVRDFNYTTVSCMSILPSVCALLQSKVRTDRTVELWTVSYLSYVACRDKLVDSVTVGILLTR